MEKYLCEICGKKHDIYRGLRSPLPSIFDEIPDAEKDSRIKNSGNIYVIDENTVLGLGNVVIEMENLDEPIFCWEVWVKISKESLSQHVEKFKTKSLIELEGILLSELPFYKKSKGLKSRVVIPTSNDEDIEIRIEENSLLKVDQSKPITKSRMIEIMQIIHHNTKRESRRNFDKPFEKRLSEELINVETEYIANEKDFVIDISTGTVLFQIVSNRMLEVNQKKERGFGLHLSFDETNDESTDEITKFRSKDYSKEFEYHDLDEIPTYQIDLGTNKKRLGKLVSQLIIDVYGEELESVETDNFEI